MIKDICLISAQNGKHTYARNVLERGGMFLEDSLKVGDIAPDFTLPATTKETISLSDYKGKKNVVVAFYGMDFTPG